MANCYIHPCNRKAAEFLLGLGYKLTPGVKIVDVNYDYDWGYHLHYCVLYVDFPGSGTAFHKLLAANNLLFNEPLLHFHAEKFSEIPEFPYFPWQQN